MSEDFIKEFGVNSKFAKDNYPESARRLWIATGQPVEKELPTKEKEAVQNRAVAERERRDIEAQAELRGFKKFFRIK